MATEPVVPVAIQGWTTSTYLLVVLNGLFAGGLLAAIVKVWPRLKEIAANARRDDLDDLRERIVVLEGKVTTADAAAHRAELKLVYAVNAIQLLAGDIRAKDPNNPILKQANDMLKLATTGDLGIWEYELAAVSKAKATMKDEE
ncbi:hypothetical protein HNO88_000323 [Novosphingobium chloroacetimidivorans]|uniref:Uncharacterized protein n=1 Tax=Novosphingobium chloroacetimidivorans TaxID=1428314 RepID=A0A7W7K6Y4_9SPHN|nr:hypothetical protein [Novosphingobium chloroacetimidivorans]MBB4857026.1 hypothetical protein [Novosphingobium chloroacetimidivorans]